MSRPIGAFCAAKWILLLQAVIGGDVAVAGDYRNYQKGGQLKSDAYLLKSFNERHDPLFDGNPQVVDLGLNLGIGSDCGRVDFEGTMKSTLKNLLDAKYFGNIGQNIIAASPMLLACYMSPTWCAILKHSQVNANFLSQMRLDQCALIDKYTDSRTDDYYRERQECVRQKIADNGGDLEQAMGSCQGGVYSANLGNWAGQSSGSKVPVNKLIESGTKWAGLTGPEATRTTDLLKAFVGDTVVASGNVSVEYGSRGKALTPETHLKELRGTMRQKLCEGIVLRVERDGRRQTIDQLVSERDLRDLSPDSNEVLVDRQTIEALSYMPYRQRQGACKRLADTMALTVFTKDVNRSVDVLTIAAQNPNLPPQRQAEVEEKRKRFKESVDLTLELERQRNEPLRTVLSEINGQGGRYRDRYTDDVMREDDSKVRSDRNRQTFMDCADGVMCPQGG